MIMNICLNFLLLLDLQFLLLIVGIFSYCLNAFVLKILLVDLFAILLFLSEVLLKVGLIRYFHILWFFPRYEREDYNDGLSLQSKFYDIIKDNWCVNIGSDKRPVYVPLFTFKQKFYRGKLYSNYDTHFVVPTLTSQGVSSLAFYVCKYLLKPSDKERKLQQAFKLNLETDEYTRSWNLVKSRSFRSSQFGFGFDGRNFYGILDYLHQCVIRSDRSLGYPCFFSPDDGSSFPLSPYYRNHPLVMDFKEMMDFKMEQPLVYAPDASLQDFVESSKKFELIKNMVDSKDLQLDFNFLFD